MPAENGFQLVASDLALLQHVHELRLATIDHLATLSGRSYKQTQKRLAKLEERRYLVCLARRPHKHVYTIGREGVPVLIEHGYAPRELAQKRLRQNELKELGIKHGIFVADIHVKLLQLTAGRSLSIANWVEGPSLWDTVTTSSNVIMPIRPDAWLTISGQQGRAHFFLEADRGTMAHSRMREKITAYAAYFQQQRHTKKYKDMKIFRVATVTETRGRAEGLSSEFRTMMPAAWLAAYPVIAFQDLTLQALMPELEQ
jgi:protein involved in plasmid replication-relaxation